MLGQVPRPRRARRPAARAARHHARRPAEDLHDEIEHDDARSFGRRKLLLGLSRRCRSSAWSSASSVRSGRSARSRAASGRARRGRPASRLVTVGGITDRSCRRSHVRPARDRVPRGGTSASTTPRSCCCGCRPSRLTQRTIDAGALDGWVAYSKICTHAGCSVGLFGIDNRPPDTLRQLVCPCHQSAFDPADGARPGRPGHPLAARSSALDVDAEGFLVAHGDFDRPVGPLAWDEA